MSAIELKKLLHLEIDSTENYALLEALLNYFRLETHLQEPVKLSPAQKAKIAKGRQDVAEGRIHQDEDVNQEFDEWLAK